MSAAPRAADEPRPLTPIPTSAIRIAAASLAPSPTIAVTRPQRCSAPTICTFCSGLTRANTCTSAASLADASSSRPLRSAPVITRASAGSPSWRAIARAVTGWSPVISTTSRSASDQRFDQRARRRSCGVRQADVADQLQIVRGGVDGVGIGVVVVVGFVLPSCAAPPPAPASPARQGCAPTTPRDPDRPADRRTGSAAG